MQKIAGFGEIMQRLMTQRYQTIEQTQGFDVMYTGTALNVLASLAYFGYDTRMITKLPENALGFAAMSAAQSFGVDMSKVIIGGDYLGLYFLEQGFGLRPSKVIYNREHSAFVTSCLDEYDWDAIYQDVTHVHFCGISFAVSENVRNIAVAAIKQAKERGIIVSLDFNYRPGLWRKEDAIDVYLGVLPLVDICFANQRDFSELLPFSVIDAEEEYEVMIEKTMQDVFLRYPNIQMIAGTKRLVLEPTFHQLQGFIATPANVVFSKTYQFDVLERIGGGDAFVAGVLHGYLGAEPLSYTVEFGVASSVYKHTILGDSNRARISDIEKLMKSSKNDMIER